MDQDVEIKTREILHSSLFWDTRPDKINTGQHARFIIERVVTRGTLNNWKTLVKYYGKDKILKEVLTIRNLDPKTLCYLSIFFNVEKSRFRCSS